MPVGLSEGLKVAVIGAGPAGCAFAGALLAAARALGRQVHLTLFDGQRKGRSVVAPALLDTETRCRLAALGAVLPTRPAATEVRGVLVHAAGRNALLEPPAGGLWIIDSPELAGERIVKQVLLNAATLRGAKVRASSVDAVERQGDEWIVRAHGSSGLYGLIAGAFGSDSSLAGSWPEGSLRRPRLLRCSNARTSWSGRDDLLRVCFAPTPQVDALLLVPCGASAYALAIGTDVTPSALAAALASLVRERVLPGGFRILKADRVTMLAGAAPRLAHDSQLTLGSAAMGSLLDPGLLPALVSATRSANAALELGESGPLHRRLASSQRELLEHARRQPRILRWARLAGPRLPQALSRLAAETRSSGTGFGLLGLPSLSSASVLAVARWQGVKSAVAEALTPILEADRPVPQSPIVYVVDDDPDVRAMLLEELRSRGWMARAFDDELALLDAAARERPAAILLDIVLRWVDGLSLCRELRRHPATRHSRIVSMSNLTRPADLEASLKAGADAFLTKPVDPNRLDALLGDLPRQPREAEKQAARGVDARAKG